jgi:hypothetical protein
LCQGAYRTFSGRCSENPNLAKCVLVLSKEEFITALRRGKWWKRRAALRARLAAVIQANSVVFRARRGISGKTYRLSAIVTLDNAEVLEAECDLVVSDT